MEQLVEFLKAILPDEGWYCLFNATRKGHEWFETIPTLASKLLELDAKGDTVYHACASYKDTSSREQSNVRAIRAIWLDLDRKEFPDGTSLDDMLRAVLALGRGRPICVDSGGGLHVYWRLERDVTPDEWARYASGLRSDVIDGHLRADPARTCDCASVLRPPGSHNRKYTPARQVRSNLQGSSPSLLSSLRVGDRRAHHNRGAFDFGFSPVPELIRRFKLNSHPLDLGVIYDGAPSDGRLVAEKCNQLRAMRDALGRLQEPIWKACLSVLHFCRDGDTLGHEWSRGDDRYNSKQTQGKLDSSPGPATCRHFADINSKGCEGCPFKGQVTSPIQLGREDDPPPADVPADPDLSGAVPAPPPGFEHAPVLKRLGKKEVEIFSQPLWLENILRGNDHHHLFKTIKRGRGEFTFSILSSTIGGSGCSSAMAKETGLMVGDMSAFKEYLRAREGQFIDERGYEANGWTEDWGFVCGTTYYGGSDPQPTKTTGALSGFAHRLGPKGDYEKWRTAVKMLFQYGSLAQQFAVLASFASPLMKLVSSTEGGAIVALISQEPGRGKTTALNAALSVWGEQDVLRIVNSGTPISRGTILARCNNLPCVFDEPDFLNERHNAVELINMHSAGSQRDRANQDGSLQIKSHLGWNNLFLMGANKSLWDLCRTTSNDPPSLRVLEFEAPPTDAKNWKENESYFKNAFSENYGHAGDRFLRMIAKPGMVEFLKKEAVVREKHIRSLYTFEPAHRFWVRTLVACDMASTILEQLEPWNDWAKPVLWAADRLSHEQLGREESQNFLDDVKDFIGRFYNNHQGDKSEMSQRRIMRDITELTSGRGQVVAVVIARGPFEDEMLKAGLNVRSTLKLLMKENIIIDKRWDTIGPGPPVRALRIDLRKLAIDLPTDGLEPKHLLSRKSGDPR